MVLVVSCGLKWFLVAYPSGLVDPCGTLLVVFSGSSGTRSILEVSSGRLVDLCGHRSCGFSGLMAPF